MLKDILLEKNNNFITKYGTTCNGLKPSVLYLRTKAKITPFIEKSSFEEDIEKIKSEFLNYIDKNIKKNNFFDKNYIINIDISSKSVTYGKISFLRYDIYLKPKIKKSINDNEKLFFNYSAKLDNKLSKLLNKSGIKCI